MQFGGLILFISLGQIVVATVLMAVYSWWLAALVWLAFLPLFLSLRPLQKLLSVRFAAVRENVGLMLGGISEAVVGADTIRAYGAERRTQGRIDSGVEEHRRSATSAGVFASSIFATGTLVSGLAVAAVVGVGVRFGVGGSLTIGELLAFLFLVQLFTQPVQIATEMLNELQNALAGWRRVIAVLDTPADVADPVDRPGAREIPAGPVTARFEGIAYAYPGGPPVLRGIDLEVPAQARVAVVGETGSGKTTLAKLLTRLQDPTTGRVLLNGVDLRDVPFSSLRRRVVLVPQEGFLFDVSLRENIRLARPGASDAQVELVVTEMGLQPWVEGLPHGLDTRVGQRGESLSAGERQLVAVARAYLADPDLLVLDEATSAVDPATEVRLNRALGRAHPRPDQRGHRPPAVHGGGGRPRRGRRQGAGRGDRHAHRARRRRRGLRRPAPELGGPAQQRPARRRRARPRRAGRRRAGRSARGGRVSTDPAVPEELPEELPGEGPGELPGELPGEGLEALLDRVRFGADGLVAAVAQQHGTREVLMVAWMDRAALAETLTTRRGTYFSRSRQERWRKGDTSGHVQHVVSASLDCDGDTVLLEVDQVGPACHTGTRTCFDDRPLLAPEVPA